MIDQPDLDDTRRATVRASGAAMLEGSVDTLRAAISLLTRLPMGVTGERTGARAYAIIGALIGAVGAVPLWLVGGATPVIAAVLAIAAMTALTGAIHLDGLADTADALAAIGPDAAERARKDPAIGAAGATALVLVLGLETAALTTLLDRGSTATAAAAILVAAMAGRLVPVLIARVAPAEAIGDGLGGWFAVRVTGLDARIAVAAGFAIVLAVAVVIGRAEPVTWALGGGGVAVGLSVWLLRVRRRLDGDLLGAGTELGVTATLVVAAVATAWSTG